MRRPRPIQEIEHLAGWLQAIQETMGEADDVACVILYRSELAKLVAALRGWEAERKRSHAACLTHPVAAAPTPPTEPEDLAWEGIDRMTEEELLAGLEGLCGPLEPKGRWVQPRAPKHYGQGRQGPLGVPQPSASASGRPSCSPSFGLRDSTDDTPSTDHDEEPEGI